jgi:hypothetical protein
MNRKTQRARRFFVRMGYTSDRELAGVTIRTKGSCHAGNKIKLWSAATSVFEFKVGRFTPWRDSTFFSFFRE